MNSITNYNSFVKDKDLLEKVSPEISKALEEFLNETSVNEGKLVDKIKNTASKALFGSFSQVGAIDKGADALLHLQKEMIDKKYDVEKKIDDMSTRLESIKRSQNEAQYKSLMASIDAAKKEYEAYKKVTDIKIDKAEKIISDLTKGNARRTEYWNAKETELYLELAEYELSVAKKRSADAEDIKSIQDKINSAKSEYMSSDDVLKDIKGSSKEESDKDKNSSDKSKDSSKSEHKKKSDIHGQIADVEKSIADKTAEYKRSVESFDKKDKSNWSDMKKKDSQRPILKMASEIKGEKAYLKELKKLRDNKTEKKISYSDIKKSIKNSMPDLESEVKKTPKNVSKKELMNKIESN